MEDPKDPEGDHLFQLYALMATDAERGAMADLYRRGGFGYGEVKKGLVEAAARFFAEARARRAAIEGDTGRIEAILAAGAAKARAKAREVLDRARRACGLDRTAVAAARPTAARRRP
jgi:tryptophanyl-tRNA synthetase